MVWSHDRLTRASADHDMCMSQHYWCCSCIQHNTSNTTSNTKWIFRSLARSQDTRTHVSMLGSKLDCFVPSAYKYFGNELFILSFSFSARYHEHQTKKSSMYWLFEKQKSFQWKNRSHCWQGFVNKFLLILLQNNIIMSSSINIIMNYNYKIWIRNQYCLSFDHIIPQINFYD